MPRFFKDEKYQSQFEKLGFVTMPLINQEEVRSLTQLFDKIRPEEIKGIYSNVHGNSKENNELVDRETKKILNKYLADLLIDYRLEGCTFLVKGANKESASTLHQDWNSVDENHSMSLSIWCPLIDVDENNGCLQVIPGSHNLFKSIRSMTIPSLYIDFDERIQPFLNPVPLKAGHVCFYAHNLFHGSKPNHSGIVRVASVAGVLPKNEKHLHYYLPKDSKTIEVFEIDMNFYFDGLLDLKDGARPLKFPKVKDVQVSQPSIQVEEFFDRLKLLNPEKKSNSIFKRLKSVLSN